MTFIKRDPEMLRKINAALACEWITPKTRADLVLKKLAAGGYHSVEAA